jgi:hypothetical protein
VGISCAMDPYAYRRHHYGGNVQAEKMVLILL